MMMQWQPIIGLEVHAQLKTKSKIFSGCRTTFGALPNTQACAIDLGLPGILPVLNRTVIEMAIKFGLAIHATINQHSVFARKNYFYPDLPKGYQISQYNQPIIGPGHLDIMTTDGNCQSIRINRAHLEEDAGKSCHEDFYGMSAIDLNRAGIPLLEIVSEPDIRSAKQAVNYLKTLHRLLRYLDICDGNMQEGSFRCDVNISIRPVNETYFRTRVEIKNLNSFRAVEHAIDYELKRQIDIYEANGQVRQETRLFDADHHKTYSMRSKEEASDYRYFPDPDLLPVVIDNHMIETIRQQLPELPMAKIKRFQKQYDITSYDALRLVNDIDLANYFEQALKFSGVNPKLVCHWLNGELLGALNKHNQTINNCPITANAFGELLQRIEDKKISGKIAKDVFVGMWQGEGRANDIINRRGLKQITDSEMIGKVIDDILTANPKQLEQYRSGKERLFGYFVGQVMKSTQGKANPQQVNDVLKQKLK